MNMTNPNEAKADDDPHFIGRVLEQDEAFRRLAEQRRREADEGCVSTLANVRSRLDASS